MFSGATKAIIEFHSSKENQTPFTCISVSVIVFVTVGTHAYNGIQSISTEV